jgi:hypothetical protein
MTQPAGGTSSATTTARHGPGIDPAVGPGALRLTATAATWSDPANVTQPCRSRPVIISRTPHIGGVQIAPHQNGPGSRRMRAMAPPSGATATRTAATADGHGSAASADGSPERHGRQATSGLATGVSVGDAVVATGPVGDGVDVQPLRRTAIASANEPRIIDPLTLEATSRLRLITRDAEDVGLRREPTDMRAG